MPISDDELARAKEITLEEVRLLRETRGTTNDTLAALPLGAVRRGGRRLHYPALPRERAAFRREQERGDDGTTPPEGPGIALRQRAATAPPPRPMLAGVPVGQLGSSPDGGPAAGIDVTRWEWLGPGNIGGRTRGIAVDPTDP